MHAGWVYDRVPFGLLPQWTSVLPFLAAAATARGRAMPGSRACMHACMPACIATTFLDGAGSMGAILSACWQNGSAGNLSVLVSTAAGVAGSWAAAGTAAGADGRHFPSSGQVNSGVQLRHGPHRGRLVVPRELFFGNKPAKWPTPGGFENRAGVIFSDNEQTWAAGALLPPPFREEETAVAELTNGSLVITARNGQNRSSSSLCLGGSGHRWAFRVGDACLGGVAVSAADAAAASPPAPRPVRASAGLPAWAEAGTACSLPEW